MGIMNEMFNGTDSYPYKNSWKSTIRRDAREVWERMLDNYRCNNYFLTMQISYEVFYLLFFSMDTKIFIYVCVA